MPETEPSKSVNKDFCKVHFPSRAAAYRFGLQSVDLVSDNQKLLFNPAKIFMKILHEFFMPSTLPFNPWRVSGAVFAKPLSEQGITHGNDH